MLTAFDKRLSPTKYCKHENQVLVYKKVPVNSRDPSLGLRKSILWQCTDCLNLGEYNVSKKEAAAIDPGWVNREDLRTTLHCYPEARLYLGNKYCGNPLATKKEIWAAYMKSPDWKRKRIEAFSFYGRKCLHCGNPAVQVHHLRYDMIGREPLTDLEVVCYETHQTIHDKEVKIYTPSGEMVHTNDLEGWVWAQADKLGSVKDSTSLTAALSKIESNHGSDMAEMVKCNFLMRKYRDRMNILIKKKKNNPN